MSKQVLQMKYHPAKKEIAFARMISGKETPISGGSGSILSKYINKKGQFVLQDHGNQFFKDIIEAFDGEEEVNLAVTMTKKDYEDFIQMVNYFNETSEIKINPTLLAELPDMEATYEVVKKHGYDSIDILNKNRDAFHTVNTDNENVLTCIENFAKEINEATKGIHEKIETLDHNSVNICFSGPFSSGKSFLINSLVGKAILPTGIRPETAAMFTIRSPKTNENIRIVFNITDSDISFSEISWNEIEKCFEFVAGPSESDTRKKIQQTINNCKQDAQHEQVQKILKTLNENRSVERVIDVYFPIEINNEHVQFTIYDTPGTDSGVTCHKAILKDALSEQTHSILIFVTTPNKLDGGGNRDLLEYLSEIESKEDKSTIDIGRSLFVVNYAETLEYDEDFEAIRTGKISNKEDAEKLNGSTSNKEQKIITIKLSDKKVFFTTAKYGYFAAAKRNGILSTRDEKTLMCQTQKILDDEIGQYFHHNRCASSEYATNMLQNKCKQALKKAFEADDLAQQMWIATGMYALETEIREYGEKYASAVKAFSIIDGVDKALARLDRNAQSIERQNSNDIREVEEEIATIRQAISDGISIAKKGRELAKDNIPQNVVKQLHLDLASIKNFVVNPAENEVDDILLNMWHKLIRKINKEYSPKNSAWNESNERYIEQAIRDILSDYTSHYKKERKILLESIRDSFIEDVKKSISENGELSDNAKKYITEIDAPEVDEFDEVHEFVNLYRSNKHFKKILWVEKEYLDREKFIKDMNRKLFTITEELAYSYKENYRNTLNTLLRKVESEFNLNMEKYSVSLKAKLEDKESMEELKNKILVAVDELHHCQETLNTVIWEVK